MKFILLIHGIFFWHIGLAQFDTIALKQRVNEIHTEKNHTAFWDFIFERDQNMFQSDRIEVINFENLILVSHYLNKFGYPDIDVLGEKARIINMVWLHNKYFQIKKLSYPIILQGYLKKAISEFNLRDYFLRTLYQRSFDDHGHMTKPLSQIYKELEPKMSNYIDVQGLVDFYLERENYFNQDKILIGKWKSEEIEYSGTLNENLYSRILPGAKVTIYQLPDGNYFFEPLYDGQSHDPIELKAVDNSKLNFQFEIYKTRNWYQIEENGDLVYKDVSGLELNRFHPF